MIAMKTAILRFLQYHPSVKETPTESKGAFCVDIRPVSTRDNRVLKGPLGRSLRSFARTAHSLRSLPRATVVIHESVFSLKSFFSGTIDILVVSRNGPVVVF